MFILCHHMTPCNMLKSRTARKGHGELKLILQHFKYTFHPMLPHCSQTKDNWPPNLQFSTTKVKKIPSTLKSIKILVF